MLERKDMAFLKNMNPNRLLNEKVEQVRIKEKRKLARLNSASKVFSVDGQSNTRRDVKFERLIRLDSLEDLGPVENYFHLIDPDLQNGDEPIVLDKAQQILTNLNNLENLTMLMNECQALLSSDHSQINGEYLERLLGDVKNLYQIIEQTAPKELVAISQAELDCHERAEEDEVNNLREAETARRAED